MKSYEKENHLIIVVALLIVPLSVFSTYWVNTQPVWINGSGADSEIDVNVPAKNKQIIRFIETEGEALAPGYNSTVCTAFVIRVISRFSALTKQEKNCIRIIVTPDSLIMLIKASAYQIRGVQTALAKWNKGTIIQPDDVKSGDFVQFWNLYNGRAMVIVALYCQ